MHDCWQILYSSCLIQQLLVYYVFIADRAHNLEKERLVNKLSLALELEEMEIISLLKSLLYILNLVVCWSGGGKLFKTYCNYTQSCEYISLTACSCMIHV